MFDNVTLTKDFYIYFDQKSIYLKIESVMAIGIYGQTILHFYLKLTGC